MAVVIAGYLEFWLRRGLEHRTPGSSPANATKAQYMAQLLTVSFQWPLWPGVLPLRRGLAWAPSPRRLPLRPGAHHGPLVVETYMTNACKISPIIFYPQFIVAFVCECQNFLDEILMFLVWKVSFAVHGWFSLHNTPVFYLKHNDFFIANVPSLPKLTVKLSNVIDKWDMCPSWNLYVKLFYLIPIIRT